MLKILIYKLEVVISLALKITEKNERIQRIFNDKLIRAFNLGAFDFDDEKEL